MSTVTLRQLRHDFAAVESAAQKAPVKITRRGRVIGTFTATRRGKRWTPPDLTARAKTHFGERFTGMSLIEDLEREGGR
ncbi:MAG: type II toxin-antitoxin system Phd/YefM family antitoxin [Opitutaceae bacterium]